MKIVAHFLDRGVPATGLSPSLIIYDVTDDSREVVAAAMTELGGGGYITDYPAFDSSKTYYVLADAGATLVDVDRYSAGFFGVGDVVLAYFTLRGAPAEGLSPVATVYDDDGAIVVNEQAMTELDDGFYKYEFEDYLEGETYYAICDGGAAITTNERYTAGATMGTSTSLVEVQGLRVILTEEETNAIVITVSVQDS